MAEYIEKESLIHWIEQQKRLSKVHTILIIQDIPAADVEKVVRCKDCKHWDEEIGWCDKHSHFIDRDGAACLPWESNEWNMFDADYFCKDGERRNEDEQQSSVVSKP